MSSCALFVGEEADHMCVEKHDWKEICEAASKEHDSEKLMTLVSELMKALDEEKANKRLSEP